VGGPQHTDEATQGSLEEVAVMARLILVAFLVPPALFYLGVVS